MNPMNPVLVVFHHKNIILIITPIKRCSKLKSKLATVVRPLYNHVNIYRPRSWEIMYLVASNTNRSVRPSVRPSADTLTAEPTTLIFGMGIDLDLGLVGFAGQDRWSKTKVKCQGQSQMSRSRSQLKVKCQCQISGTQTLTLTFDLQP